RSTESLGLPAAVGLGGVVQPHLWNLHAIDREAVAVVRLVRHVLKAQQDFPTDVGPQIDGFSRPGRRLATGRSGEAIAIVLTVWISRGRVRGFERLLGSPPVV